MSKWLPQLNPIASLTEAARRKLGLVIISLALTLGCNAARAATLIVNSTNDPAGFNSGITIAQLGSTITLRDAVNAANNTGGNNLIQFSAALSGQTIDLAQVGDSSNGASALRISSALTIIAPAGGLVLERSGTIATLRLFYVASSGSLTLDGFTVQNGVATYGGAVYNGGETTCSNVFFNLNTANSHGSGGAVFNTGTAVFSASLTHFQGNQAQSVGGAIYNDSTNASALSLVNCLLNNNFAVGYVVGGNNFPSDGRAGAIYNAGNASIASTEIGGNGANYDGGAILNNGVMGVTNCLLDLNAENGFSVVALYGGAIRNYGTLAVIGCTFDGNSANNRGGAVSSGGSSASTASIVNCTFHANGAGYGAAIATDSGSHVQVYNCTMAEESGYYSTWSESSSVLTIVNTILWDGFLPYGGYGGSTVQSNNIASRYNSDPQLLTYSFAYGGPTFGLNGNTLPMYGLPATSPAVNAGVSLPGVTTDQRGFPRDAFPDIGAYEYQSPAFVSASATSFAVGQRNKFLLIAGGASPLFYSLSGTLPAGVTLTTNGILSGTPAVGSLGSYPLSLTVSNSFAPVATQNFTLNVVDGSPFAAHPSFGDTGLNWALNGDPVNRGPDIANDLFTLTDGSGGETRSAWYEYPLFVGGFQASFTYQDIGGSGADGMAFVIQNSASGTAAIGNGGGGLGYTGISPSVAVMLNIYAGSTGGASGVLVATNGAGDGAGYWPAIYQSTAPVNLDAGNPINVNLLYLNGSLQISLTDTLTSSNYTTIVPINLPRFVGTNTAYVGVTGSEGGILSHQTVSNFSYTPLPTLAAGLDQNGSLVITWPAASYGFTLQSNPSLNNPAGWTTVALTITQTNGVDQVVIPSPTGSQFYRLAL